MRHIRTKQAAAMAAVGTLAIGAAFAAALDALPPEQVQGDVTYVTGGIGKDESDAMKQAQKQYPLSLAFVERAKPRDEYLAAVDVTIKDGKGNMQLQATSGGPYLLAKLPDGKYTVTAEYNGKAESRHVTVATHNPKQLVFAW